MFKLQKCLEHSMKVIERVFERRLGEVAGLSDMRLD